MKKYLLPLDQHNSQLLSREHNRSSMAASHDNKAAMVRLGAIDLTEHNSFEIASHKFCGNRNNIELFL